MNIQMPDTQAITNENLVVVERTNAIVVVTHEDYLVAGEQLKQIKSAQKKVMELFREPKDNAFKAHRSITEAEKKLLDPLKRAETICAGKVQTYLAEERKRQQAEQERLRLEAEAKAKAEAEAQKQRDEEERLAAAQALEAQGFTEEANALISQDVPEPIVAPVIAKPIEMPKRVDGVHTRTTYKAEVTNLLLLVQEVAAGRQPVSVLMANEQVLNKMAAALKSELRIPGVKVIEQTSVVAKANYA